MTPVQASKNLLQVVYDKGVKVKWDDFDTMRKRINAQWHSLPKSVDTKSLALVKLIQETILDHKQDEAKVAALLN